MPVNWRSLQVTETGMGRVEDKFAKNVAQARGTPGVECLTPQVLTGDNGLTLIENAPWGVVALGDAVHQSGGDGGSTTPLA